MKKSLFILLLVFVLMPANSEAQFLKKLKNTVRESVENAAIDQAANTAANKTAEAIDGTVNKAADAVIGLFSKKKNKRKKNRRNNDEPDYADDQQDNGQYNDDTYEDEAGYPDQDEQDMRVTMKKVDPSSLPDSYRFSWLYTMQMQSDGQTFNMDYYLQPGVNYFGAKPDMKRSKSVGNIIMILDTETNTNVIFMDMNGKKMAMPSSLAIDTEFDPEEVDNSNNFTFKEIGGKKILGYKCQGYKMENDEIATTIYVTQDAPVSFTQLFKGNKNTPKGFDARWMDKLDNSLVMEMHMVSKEDGSETTMKCLALKKQDLSINTGDYKFLNMSIPLPQD